MLIQRRDFLKTSSLATSTLWLPKFLQGFQVPGSLASNGKVLIVLQLSGGNDGLNTVIPVRNDIYYKERPRLGIAREAALSLTDEVGLHPALTGLKSLYDGGDMAILNSVGYPNPDRSHFRSMDIWHTASPANEYWNTGWLGRFIDAQCSGCPHPASAALELDDTLSLALKGVKAKGLALEDPKKLYEGAKSPFFKAYSAAHTPLQQEAPVDYLYKTMAETLSSADYLYGQSRQKPTSAVYPGSELGKNFKTIASLILADTDTSVYYLSHGSFDTHVGQEGQQQRLFSQMNEALAAFIEDMKKNGKWKDVLIVTFSEFGRRVAQNASGGTDHGAANNLFVMGGGLKQRGLLNAMPDLNDLQEGDLKFKVDFREVYATLLGNWLQTDADAILGSKLPKLGFV